MFSTAILSFVCQNMVLCGNGLISFSRLVEPFPKHKILDSSQLKEFVDNNVKTDENGGKFSKQVENTMGKGEIARDEQFLCFPLCFQNTNTTDT